MMIYTIYYLGDTMFKETFRTYCIYGHLSRYFINESKFIKCQKKVKKLLKTGIFFIHDFDKHFKDKLVIEVRKIQGGYLVIERYKGEYASYIFSKEQLKSLFDIV